jgi:membrane-associated phospholipid phosphatase
MKAFFKNNFIFISIYILMLFKVGDLLLKNGKVQIHRSINSTVGNQFFDQFFKFVTHLGDGLFAILIAVITLFFNVKKSLYILFSYIFASLTTSIIKNYIYIDTCRPSFAFEFFVREPLKLVEGVEMNIFNSFPSGHSTSAFAVFISLMFLSNNFFMKLLWFLIAFMAAYSRTYLSQHWLVDIYFGSLIGFSFSIFLYFFFYKKKYFQFLETGILKLNKKS